MRKAFFKTKYNKIIRPPTIYSHLLEFVTVEGAKIYIVIKHLLSISINTIKCFNSSVTVITQTPIDSFVPTISCHSGKSYQLARPLVFNSQHDGYTDGFADVSAIPHLFHPIQFNFIDIPTYRYFCPPPSSIAFRSPIRD